MEKTQKSDRFSRRRTVAIILFTVIGIVSLIAGPIFLHYSRTSANLTGWMAAMYICGLLFVALGFIWIVLAGCVYCAEGKDSVCSCLV